MTRKRIVDHLAESSRLKLDCAEQLPGAIEQAFDLKWGARPRPGAAALALTTDTSILTAVGNDLGFEEIFARQVEALGSPGDCLIGISTSGESLNVQRAMERARSRGVSTVGLLGMGGGSLKSLSDAVVVVPSQSVPRIQEAHITIGHIWCDLIDERLAAQAAAEKATQGG